MWLKGTIAVNMFDEDKPTVTCQYWIKQFEKGSQFGIKGGRISKLTIKINGCVTCRYDRGWDIKPKDETTKQVFEILMHDFN